METFALSDPILTHQDGKKLRLEAPCMTSSAAPASPSAPRFLQGFRLPKTNLAWTQQTLISFHFSRPGTDEAIYLRHYPSLNFGPGCAMPQQHAISSSSLPAKSLVSSKKAAA